MRFSTLRGRLVRVGGRLAVAGSLVAAMPLAASGAGAAQAASNDAAVVNPQAPMDSVISGTSSFDRTRPFAVGEKVCYFVNIRDGDKVRSPFRVAFVVSGMGVAPVKAGNIDGTGHHHILIDMPMPADIKAPIPFDKPDEYLHQHYKHFGNGETETVLNLPPGKHTLRLLFADYHHVPYYIASKEIEIEVVKPDQ